MNNSIKKNNKGFSLVELIVVIAIMVVLVAVLAPVFTKYVEQSRRATDCSNASTIAESILVAVADNELSTSTTLPTGVTGVVAGAATQFTDTTCSTVKSAPKVSGHKVAGATDFFYLYNSSDNTVYVYVNNSVSATNTLTTEAGAAAYKADTN